MVDFLRNIKISENFPSNVLGSSNNVDANSRSFKTLRVSLTDKCNLACQYCVASDESTPKLSSLKASAESPPEIFKENSIEIAKEISMEQQLQIIERLHKTLSLQEIHITGGEPLLHKNLGDFLNKLRSFFNGIIKITTNGLLLEKKLSTLIENKIDGINVSLDAIDEEIFRKMANIQGSAQNSLKKISSEKIQKAIIEARQKHTKVKINSTILRDVNENQILPLLHFAFEHKIEIRFLELMNMGHLFLNFERQFFPMNEMLVMIQKDFHLQLIGRKPHATALQFLYYPKSPSEKELSFQQAQVLGIIANHSQSFCKDCDRLRLDSRGKIYGCLSNSAGISLANVASSEYQPLLKQALTHKQLSFSGSALSMKDIGG